MNKQLLNSIENYRLSEYNKIYKKLILICQEYIEKYRTLSIISENKKYKIILNCLKIGLLSEPDWEDGHNFFIKDEYCEESPEIYEEIENELDEISYDVNCGMKYYSDALIGDAREYESRMNFYSDENRYWFDYQEDCDED